MGIDDVLVGAFVIVAIAVTLSLAAMASSSSFAARYEVAVLEPSADAPRKYVYVVEGNPPHLQGADCVDTASRRSLRCSLFIYPTADPRVAESAAGRRVLARFVLWPGGYKCERYERIEVRFGPDPYTGLWCPTPWRSKAPPGCAPQGVQSAGRVLLVKFVCR